MYTHSRDKYLNSDNFWQELLKVYNENKNK